MTNFHDFFDSYATGKSAHDLGQIVGGYYYLDSRYRKADGSSLNLDDYPEMKLKLPARMTFDNHPTAKLTSQLSMNGSSNLNGAGSFGVGFDNANDSFIAFGINNTHNEFYVATGIQCNEWTNHKQLVLTNSSGRVAPFYPLSIAYSDTIKAAVLVGGGFHYYVSDNSTQPPYNAVYDKVYCIDNNYQSGVAASPESVPSSVFNRTIIPAAQGAFTQAPSSVEIIQQNVFTKAFFEGNRFVLVSRQQQIYGYSAANGLLYPFVPIWMGPGKEVWSRTNVKNNPTYAKIGNWDPSVSVEHILQFDKTNRYFSLRLADGSAWQDPVTTGEIWAKVVIARSTDLINWTNVSAAFDILLGTRSNSGLEFFFQSFANVWVNQTIRSYAESNWQGWQLSRRFLDERKGKLYACFNRAIHVSENQGQTWTSYPFLENVDFKNLDRMYPVTVLSDSRILVNDKWVVDTQTFKIDYLSTGQFGAYSGVSWSDAGKLKFNPAARRQSLQWENKIWFVDDTNRSATIEMWTYKGMNPTVNLPTKAGQFFIKVSN